MPGAGGRMTLLIAAIGFAGVTIGVASLVLVISFMNGAEARLAGQIASADGHIFVTAKRLGIKNPVRLERTLAPIDGVEAATASLEGAGMIGVNGRFFAADLQGLTPYSMVQSPLFQGKAATIIGSPSVRSRNVAIGSDLATRLGVRLGDHAAISAIRYNNGNISLDNYDVVVSGVVSTGVYALDSRRVIMPVGDLRPISSRIELANKISVRLKNNNYQSAILDEIGRKLGSHYDATTWQSMNVALFLALSQEKLAMTVVISIVTIIALSNILSSMVMLVRYKSREIAILRTVGMSRRSIAKVFVGVGAAIGFAGETAGLGVGLSLKAAKDPITQAIAAHTARPSMELDVLLSLPLAISSTEITWVVALVSIGVLLSTFYPAMRAAAIDPASVLRHT